MQSRTLVIRTATRADVAAVDRLLAATYPRLLKADYPPSVMVTAVPLISRAKPRLVTCGSYYVVETADGSIVAGGGWTSKGHDGSVGGSVGEVRHVVVDWRLPRQGIGRRLMETILGDAADTGILRMDCLATRTAVPFYEAIGFRRLGEIDLNLSPGITMPVMQMQRML